MLAPCTKRDHGDILPLSERVLLSRETLLAVPLKVSEWSYVDCFKEDWDGMWMRPGGWGRIIGGKHVCVINNRCGENITTWRLYVDGEMKKELRNVGGQFGGGKYAMKAAEEWMKRSAARLG